MTTCPKCQYQRVASDTAPDWQCPKCGVAYAKVMGSPTTTARVRDRETGGRTVEPGSNGKTIMVACLLVALAGFGIWKTTRPHSSPAASSASSRFDAAKKAFQDDNFQEATKEFTTLAEAGDAKAQYYLGRIYALDWSQSSLNGKDVRQASDRQKSVYWYTKAGEQGEVLAQLELGKLYASNLAGGTDPQGESAKWYRLAADQGNPEAQYITGSYHERGRGVAKDLAQARQWYRSAAEQGHAGGMYGLGMLYAWGKGVTESRLTAYKLIHLAAARYERDPSMEGAFWAKKASEDLAKTLSSAELAEADALLANWQPGMALPQ
ncbi:MAG: tetratricopeptide repeat protein [Azonexus sp.]